MSASGSEKPVFLLSGGRQTGSGDMARQLAHALGGLHKPHVAYIGAANGDNVLFYERMKSFLAQGGAGKVVFVRLAKKRIDADAAMEALSAANVVFLAGGEVEDGMNWLRRHGLVDFLRELHGGGKQFVGVSAGTIMMGAHWVRWENPEDDATAGLFDCLGLVPFVFDTHAEDEDWVELKTALRLMGSGTLGYGVPSGGFVRADSQGKLANLEKACLAFVNDGGQIRLL